MKMDLSTLSQTAIQLAKAKDDREMPGRREFSFSPIFNSTQIRKRED